MKQISFWVSLLILLGNQCLLAGLNDGLVAYYPFNGNANDASGNGNNGTVCGAVLTTNRFGVPNSAYDFDGATTYIRVPDSDSLELTNDFSLSVWVNRRNNAPGVPMGILCKHIAGFNFDGTWMFQIYPIKGTVDFEATPYFDPNTESITAPTQLSWHHLVFNYQKASQVWTMYIDGVLDNFGPTHYG